jgi:hypothetical protein
MSPASPPPPSPPLSPPPFPPLPAPSAGPLDGLLVLLAVSDRCSVTLGKLRRPKREFPLFRRPPAPAPAASRGVPVVSPIMFRCSAKTLSDWICTVPFGLMTMPIGDDCHE